MKVLIDAHVFLWWVLDRPELSDRCRSVLSDGDNEILLSVASAYEIAYKAEHGRLTLPGTPADYVRSRIVANAFATIPIELEHVLRAAMLPPIHGDPFDRMLIAQAQLEGIPILTADRAVSRYDVETIW